MIENKDVEWITRETLKGVKGIQPGLVETIVKHVAGQYERYCEANKGNSKTMPTPPSPPDNHYVREGSEHVIPGKPSPAPTPLPSTPSKSDTNKSPFTGDCDHTKGSHG